VLAPQRQGRAIKLASKHEKSGRPPRRPIVGCHSIDHPNKKNPVTAIDKRAAPRQHDEFIRPNRRRSPSPHGNQAAPPSANVHHMEKKYAPKPPSRKGRPSSKPAEKKIKSAPRSYSSQTSARGKIPFRIMHLRSEEIQVLPPSSAHNADSPNAAGTRKNTPPVCRPAKSDQAHSHRRAAEKNATPYNRNRNNLDASKYLAPSATPHRQIVTARHSPPARAPRSAGPGKKRHKAFSQTSHAGISQCAR